MMDKNPLLVRFWSAEKFHAPQFGMFYALCLLLTACATEYSGQSSDDADFRRADSKYDSQLPNIGVIEASGASAEKTVRAIPDSGSELPADAYELSGLSVDSAPQVRPVVLLTHNFTIELGVFATFEEAAKMVRQYQLSAEEAGIADIHKAGETFYLLAYGVYSDRMKAEQVAVGLSERLDVTAEVRSLAEIEALTQAE